jgi:hypothetical protein
MSNRTSSPSDGVKTLIAKSGQGPSLEDIEETETALWVERQLRRIRVYLFERRVDNEMLEALDMAIEANDFCIDPKLAEDLRTGSLRSGQA